jgi:hypothetical protein
LKAVPDPPASDPLTLCGCATLWLELTSAISKGATNFDPAIDRLARIVKVLSLQKDESETKAINGPPKPKQIAPPDAPKADEDDDIPF